MNPKSLERGPAGARGVSLIEVLAAFVILSMSMAVILRINATALRNHEVSKQYLRAVEVAQYHMTEMGVDDRSSQLVREGREVDGMTWRYVRQPYTLWQEEKFQGVQAEPVEERIQVAWVAGNGQRELSFSKVTLRYPAR